MAERNLRCPETEEPCIKGCKIGDCRLEREDREREAQRLARENEAIDIEARKMAPAYFRRKKILNPTEAQVRKFIQHPKVRATANERLKDLKSIDL